MAFSAVEITHDDGTENMGGFLPWVAIIPTSHITTEAILPASPTTDAQFVTLDGNHTLAEGKYFKKVYATPETVSYKSENQGEIDGQSLRNSGSFFHPGSSDSINALARMVNNGNFVVILFEESGRRIQVGTKRHPARFKPSSDYGKAPSDRKGHTFEFYSDSFVNTLRYNGTIAYSATITDPAITP